MATPPEDFTGILVHRQIVTVDQAQEAVALARQTWSEICSRFPFQSTRLPCRVIHDCLVKLGYATCEQVMSAIAEQYGLELINPAQVTIPQAVLDLLPDSVARENVVLPLLGEDDGSLKIILSDPSDVDTVQKLQFILDKDIHPAVASREQIIEAINRHYGPNDTKSTETMLREFGEMFPDGIDPMDPFL